MGPTGNVYDGFNGQVVEELGKHGVAIKKSTSHKSAAAKKPAEEKPEEESWHFTSDDSDSYVSEDEDILGDIDRENLTFHFTMKREYVEAVNTRFHAVTGADEPDEEPERMLHKIYKTAKTTPSDKLPIGKGKGLVIPVPGSSNIKVRLDRPGVGKKDDIKLYPRVFRRNEKEKKDEKDLTTEEIAALSKKHMAYSKSFFAGLAGTKQPASMGKTHLKAENDAYADGDLVRHIFLISDLLDFPGNSAITQDFLCGVTDDENFQILVTGGKPREGSYGALASQNTHNGLEEDKERIAPYNAVGELFKKGHFSTSAVSSNQPMLRKLASVSAMDKRIFKVRRSNERVQSAAKVPFESKVRVSNSRFVREGGRIKQISVSAATAKYSQKGFAAFALPEAKREDEEKKLDYLADNELELLEAEIDEHQKALDEKRAAIKSVKDRRRAGRLEQPKLLVKAAAPKKASVDKKAPVGKKVAERKRSTSPAQRKLRSEKHSPHEEPSASSSSSDEDTQAEVGLKQRRKVLNNKERIRRNAEQETRHDIKKKKQSISGSKG
ncbi:hypothetical protein SNE35_26660 [Paucibacter sp. R3-3]|uniref:Uncharacterized protein n=1 Tax=Roseateles agri TaxID=3098619 RepID=A0ABU5DQX5_9BURK|nr:hypothetical protein [Paucibacter sp. R3-3]MDY0748111.1 hypothetical protein [Paucibacter sp. R3-3]